MKKPLTPIQHGEPSDNERIKRESHYLRGTLATDLQNGLTGGFNDDNIQLVKFHGMYQQDDRDIRAERVAQKLEPRHHLMFRARLPGGVVTTAQWLGIDEWADKLTIYGSIRITTRQTFQYHGIFKRDLKTLFAEMYRLGIDSIFTAGDVNRNVICTSNPEASLLHQQAYAFAKKLSEHFLPHTTAYAEVWLDKEKVFDSQNSTGGEPIYGETFLPRKFKSTVSIPPHNDIDLYANDLNFIAIANEDQTEIIGFNVLIGGGLGMTHGDQSTFPRAASLIGYVDHARALEIATAVVTTQRDLGNRSNRRLSKLKHTIEDYGLDNITAEIERRAGFSFEPAREFSLTTRGDRFGWVQGTDGRAHLTLYIENGRILDHPEQQDRCLKTGLKEIALFLEQHGGGEFRMTANQNLMIAQVKPEHQKAIEVLAKTYGLWHEAITPVRQQAMACVSLPTCPLAMAEAERYLPDFLQTFEAILAQHQLLHVPIIVRITGCPNGCARAMLAEIGLVGKAAQRYNLYIGGNRIGSRIPRLYRENITVTAIYEVLAQLVAQWAQHRFVDEDFGDFVIRFGIVEPVLAPAQDFYKTSAMNG